MTAPYPTPATPLPWHGHKADITAVRSVMGSQDTRYIVHAANAFPHLFAALDWIYGACAYEDSYTSRRVRDKALEALAIARGEVTP